MLWPPLFPSLRAPYIIAFTLKKETGPSCELESSEIRNDCDKKRWNGSSNNTKNMTKLTTNNSKHYAGAFS
jgi:hypothetical protein